MSTTSGSSTQQPTHPSSRRAAQLRSPSFPMPATPLVSSSARSPSHSQASPRVRGGIEVVGGVPVVPTSPSTSATPSSSPSHIGLQLSGVLTQNISTTTLVEASPLLTRRVSRERISTCATFAVSPRPVPIPLPAHLPIPMRVPLGNPTSPAQSGSACVSMPVPITMPIPEPVRPPISVLPAPSLRRIAMPAVSTPAPRPNVVGTTPSIAAGRSIAPSTAPPLSRVPTQVTHRERTLVHRPSTDSERTAVAHTQQTQRNQDPSNALPDLPAPRKKGESYWAARGQHLYEDLTSQPKLKETFPCGALVFSDSCPRIRWNILFPPSTAVDMTVGDGMSPLKEKYLDSPATVPSLKVINLVIPDRISGAWTIKVTNAERGHIVKIGDVLSALSANLHTPVYDHEPQWLSLNEKQQTEIAKTLHKNRALAGTQVGANLRRLDFLEGRNVFVGLSRDYAKCGLPMWKKFVPGLKPFGEEMWNFWVVELEEVGPSPPRYFGDR
ncbi:hypothetical protein M407DRAFT_29884 [Tulasnella calospora MUT 4182]|uniref:DUF6699 domain-containing protein n=1 Tax=Tulasnella calospora MUT 4182 TaxID=1051891 RepID=A0A0C3LG98_9AGAM|nr:hypothetical protein M407DRAFT_29884 [Tulasnella calospora MUT 4182]